MWHSEAMADGELLTVEQAAEKLKMHPDTIRRLLRDGQLPGIKLGKRQWRIPSKALDDYIQRGLGQTENPKLAEQ